MISIRLDVTKIEKERLYKGEKGTYLNCIMIDTPESDYGDFMIVQEVSKEEREAGTKGTILGNGKIFVKREQNEPNQEPQTDEGNDLPF